MSNALEARARTGQWFYIPSVKELERLAKYANSPEMFTAEYRLQHEIRPHGNETCPKCGGRLVMEFQNSNVGGGTVIVCRMLGVESCDFREDITDYEMF